MKQNVGTEDKLVRILLGAVSGGVSLGILGGVVSGPALLSPLLGVVSLVLLYTAFTGFCGVYSVMGIDTCAVEPDNA